MGETVFQELVLRARLARGTTQEGFARLGPFARGSVANWEQGKKRPSPHALRRIAELVPSVRDEVDRLIASYEWHPKRVERADGLRVPADLRARISTVAKKLGVDEATALRQALDVGLHLEEIKIPPSAADASTKEPSRPRYTQEDLERKTREARELIARSNPVLEKTLELMYGSAHPATRRRKTKSTAA